MAGPSSIGSEMVHDQEAIAPVNCSAVLAVIREVAYPWLMV